MEVLLDNLYKKLRAKSKYGEFQRKYSFLKTDEERVKFTINICEENDIKFEMKSQEKSKSDATRYNEKATKLYLETKSYKVMDLDSIIQIYTMSIAYAPANSFELSLAYANRSLVLFKARLYRDCIDDIERSLMIGCPDKLKAKLYARKARCNVILNSTNSTQEIENALKQDSKHLEKVDLNDKSMKIVEKTIRNPEQLAPKQKEFIKLDRERNLPEIPNDNKEIPGASSAIKLVYSKKYGTHVLATRDIEPGEILAVQKGCVSNLYPQNFYDHCIYCLKQTWSGIPCNKCVYAIYCSETCQKAAWINHHDIECQVVGSLIAVHMLNRGLMSLRLIISAVKETEDFKLLKNHVETIDLVTDQIIRGITRKILDDQKYASVYTMETNSKHRSIRDLFERSFKAVYIAFVLAKKSKIFGKVLPGDLGNLKNHQWFTFVGRLIMRHQQIIPSNLYARCEEHLRFGTDEIGSVLIPFYSLFNHSCVPSIHLVGFGNNIASIATRTIKKNQQIFINYGMHYIKIRNTSSRQRFLEQNYFFTCKCEACSDVSLDIDGPQSYMLQPLGSKARAKINNALKNLDNYYKMYMSFTENIIEDSVAVITDLTNMLKVLEKYVDLYSCAEANKVVQLWERLNNLRGNRQQSINN